MPVETTHLMPLGCSEASLVTMAWVGTRCCQATLAPLDRNLT